MPSNRNIIQKEAENVLKYKNLSGNVGYEMLVIKKIIIRCTGIVIKGLKISTNNIRKKFNRFSTKSSCTRGTAHNKQSATV
jgi:hypothetical protein